MVDFNYIVQKLDVLAASGEHEILVAINEAQSAAAKAGALGGTRSLLINVGLVRDGYRTCLERMSRLLIDLGANTDPAALGALRTAAAKFADSISAKKSFALFGVPAFDPQARSRAASGLPILLDELHQIADAVISDVQNGVVRSEVIPRPACVTTGPSAQHSSLVAALERLKLTEADTSTLANCSHQQLIEKVKVFVTHHATSQSWDVSVTTTQGLRDSGTDVIVGTPSKLGFQIKCNGDFFRATGEETFRRTVLAQIQESKKQKLGNLVLMLAGDLTNSSVREKSRGLLAELHSAGDPYVLVVEPETMAGLARWTGA